jgi:gliding-associated putative ABC transporter substrate-binding component GldG
VALMAKELNKTRTGGNAIGFVVLTIVGLIAVNLIASRMVKRVDFTADRIYTLSQASKDLVAKLPDRMTVKAFISNDLQPPFSTVATYTRDLLDEYATASKGKLVWEVVDPGSDTKLEEEATKLKVPKMRRGRVSNNKVEIGANYLGVAFQYQGNIESIPEISSPEGLEFQMTSLIKLLTTKKKKIAFATSEGELSTTGDPQGGHGGGLQIVRQYMKDYEVVPVALNTGDKPLADDIDALIIAGPKQPMVERSKFILDQFLMKGKAVGIFVDGMVIESPRNMQVPGMDGQPRIGRKNDVGMDDLLEHYGFKVRDDVILEPKQNVPGPVSVQGQMFLANYPTFLASTKVAEKHSVMDHVKAVILPFASSVERVKDKQPGLEVTELAASTPEAWRQGGFFLYDPQNAQLKVGDDKGPFSLAFAAKGKMKSFFAGKPYPNEKGEKVNAPDPNVSAAPGEVRPLDESTGTPRLLLVGDSEFASDEYLRFGRQVPTYGSNLLFFMNMMDYLAGDETLAPIRAKTVQSRPITVASDSSVLAIKMANIVGVPLAFILFGVVRWRMRSARRKNAKL